MSSILKVDTLQDVNGNAIISSDGSGNISIPNLTTTGDINFGDNDKAVFGAGSDLEIYHDGSNSYVWDTGTGNLILVSDGSGIEFKKNDGEYLASFSNDGPATLYYDNSAKLATTSGGIDVTGTVVSDGLTVDTDTLYVDTTNNRVGVGTGSPSQALDVVGNVSISNDLSVSGNVPANTGPAFRATASTSQTFTTAVAQKVTLGTEVWDTNSNFDNVTNYRFTPTVAGYYQVNGGYSFNSASSAGWTLFTYIAKNGSEYIRGAEMYSLTATFNHSVVNGVVYMNGTTDYIELYAMSIGGTINTGSTSFCFMDATLVRKA